MVGVLKHVDGGGVDRHRPGRSGWVWFLPRVQGLGSQTIVFLGVAHGLILFVLGRNVFDHLARQHLYHCQTQPSRLKKALDTLKTLLVAGVYFLILCPCPFR
jgi:hypothetical protein